VPTYTFFGGSVSYFGIGDDRLPFSCEYVARELKLASVVAQNVLWGTSTSGESSKREKESVGGRVFADLQVYGPCRQTCEYDAIRLVIAHTASMRDVERSEEIDPDIAEWWFNRLTFQR
jgi:hypothetical protein